MDHVVDLEGSRDWSPDVFAAWVAPHRPAMLGFASRLTSSQEAEDIVQEALTLAWRRRDRFDPHRGSPRTWLLTLTADQVRRYRRRWRRSAISGRRVPDVGLAAEYADIDLRAAVSALSVRQQLAVNAYYYLDLPIEAVAVVMGCSVGTVKSTLAAARRRLHIALEPGEPT